jgi:5-methylcytosine-specific restriction protein A
LKARPKGGVAFFNESYIENRAIINFPNVPIFAFVRPTDEGPFTLKGVYRNEKVHSEVDGSKWFELVRIDTATSSTPIAEEELIADTERQVARSRSLSRRERLARLSNAPRKPAKVSVVASGFARNPDVIAEVLERAAGTCEICKQAAPFTRQRDNTPYLEVHHIVQLANGGEDTIENAVAACPNCHRREHFGAPQLMR